MARLLRTAARNSHFFTTPRPSIDFLLSLRDYENDGVPVHSYFKCLGFGTAPKTCGKVKRSESEEPSRIIH